MTTCYTIVQTDTGRRTALIYIEHHGRYSAYRQDGTLVESGGAGDARYLQARRDATIGTPPDVASETLTAIRNKE